MLQPPSSSSTMPLFTSSLSSSSSCGMEDLLIIQRPSSEAISFDWSDFPIIQQQDVFTFSQMRDVPPVKPQSPSRDSSSVTLSTCSSDSDLSMSSSKSSSSKRVTFADSLEVRTHSVVLGDHPCCQSLALELGWDYEETKLNLNDREQQKAFVYNQVRRLSYMERKALLKRVTGMSDLEIQHLSNHMKHSAPSTRRLCQMASV